MLGQIYTWCCFGSAAVALLIAVITLTNEEYKAKEDWGLSGMAAGSLLWSLGCGLLIASSDTEIAKIYFDMAQVGVYMFAFTFLFMVVCVNDVYRKKDIEFIIFICLGIISLAWYLSGDVTAKLTPYGMSCTVDSGVRVLQYMVFILVAAAQICNCAVRKIRDKHTHRRIRIFDIKVLVLLCLIVAASVPAYTRQPNGQMNLPWVTVIQFFVLILFFFTESSLKKSSLRAGNLSEYIYGSIAVPVLVYDENRRLKLANHAGTEVLGVSQYGIASGQVYPVEELFVLKNADADIFGMDKDSGEFDARFIADNTPCTISVNRIRDNYSETIGYVLVITDQSEHEKLTREMEKARIQAEDSNRAKSDFMARMSHELRTPMNSIIGFSELMLKMEGLPEEAVNCTTDIRDSASSLLVIINDLLDISKIEAGRMELNESEYPPRRIFEDIYAVNRQSAEQKGLEFLLDIDPDIPDLLFGDRAILRSILINLISNSVKYTKQGFVKLSAKAVSRSDGSVRLEFRVSDSGVGIKDGDIGRLFNDYEQVNRELHRGVEGTGLGLPIVKKYTDLMGGSIEVKSEFGKGSEFIVSLSQGIASDKPMGEITTGKKNQPEKSSIGSLKVKDVTALVVDDNMVNLKVAKMTMASYGLIIDTASSGAEAIDKCGQKDYDFVFMDQMMPEMDGPEAEQNIRNLSAHYAAGGKCIMIALTANAVTGVRDEMLQAGFDEYLSKPINYRRLEQLLLQFLTEDRLIRQ